MKNTKIFIAILSSVTLFMVATDAVAKRKPTGGLGSVTNISAKRFIGSEVSGAFKYCYYQVYRTTDGYVFETYRTFVPLKDPCPKP